MLGTTRWLSKRRSSLLSAPSSSDCSNEARWILDRFPGHTLVSIGKQPQWGYSPKRSPMIRRSHGVSTGRRRTIKTASRPATARDGCTRLQPRFTRSLLVALHRATSVSVTRSLHIDQLLDPFTALAVRRSRTPGSAPALVRVPVSARAPILALDLTPIRDRGPARRHVPTHVSVPARGAACAPVRA